LITENMVKILITAIYLFFVSAQSFGQAQSGIDNVGQQSLWMKYNVKYDNPKYVLDSKPLPDSSAKRVLDGIDPYNVTKVLIEHASIKNARNIVYIITSTEKALAYQKKFGSFSSNYKNYVKDNNNSDRFCIYDLDGQMVSGERRDVIDKLYTIPAAKIISVDCSVQTSPDGRTKMAMVEIITSK
jgi:hypothetical protein